MANHESPATAASLDSPGLVSDCRLMLSFARKNAFVLPPSLAHEIGWLDSVLKALGMAPVSQVSTSLVWPIDLEKGPPLYVSGEPAAEAAGTAPGGRTPEEVILDVHSRLSLLITPTTALSLQTSEPPAGKRHIFGGMPPLVQYVILIAFVSAICFAVSASRIGNQAVHARAAVAMADAARTQPKASSDVDSPWYQPGSASVVPDWRDAPAVDAARADRPPASAVTVVRKAEPARESSDDSLADTWWTSLNAFFGAVLGASFYVLVKTQPYLANRSYDPKFNASYISRFFTGVIGGLILAIAFGPFLSAKLGAELHQSLSPGVLALLGGFSARAVELILQRLVEVLLAAVRGDGSDDARARLASAAAARDAAIRKSLDAVIDAHMNGAPAAKVKALLDGVRDEVSKPTKF